MYEKVGFKFNISLNTKEDVSLCRKYLPMNTDHHYFTVSSTFNSPGIYINSNSRGSSLKDLSDYLSRLYNEVNIPDVISTGFINHNPSTEESGIVIFRPRENTYSVVQASTIIEAITSQQLA